LEPMLLWHGKSCFKTLQLPIWKVLQTFTEISVSFRLLFWFWYCGWDVVLFRVFITLYKQCLSVLITTLLWNWFGPFYLPLL